MRSLICVSSLNGKFTISASGKFGGGYSGLLVPDAESAASRAVAEAVRYCTSEGCTILAPQSVSSLLPADFSGRDITVNKGF